MHFPFMRRWFLIVPILLSLASAAELKVATLHPLLAGLAREIGGERVEIVDLVPVNSDPHHFEPTIEQLKRAADANLYLASGMGLESYLPSLATTIGPAARIVEIGATIPAIEGECDHPDHHHDHAEHPSDPHWWHSIDAFRRAATITAGTFAEADPAGTEIYEANALAYRARLDELDRWVRREVARIPRDQRVLATAHAAFGYFCRDYGFEALPVQGINREQMPDPASLAKLIARLREKHVPVIFPEKESNPKILAAITRDTGIRLAEPLIADGSTAESYEAMIRHNVGAITKALGK